MAATNKHDTNGSRPVYVCSRHQHEAARALVEAQCRWWPLGGTGAPVLTAAALARRSRRRSVCATVLRTLRLNLDALAGLLALRGTGPRDCIPPPPRCADEDVS